MDTNIEHELIINVFKHYNNYIVEENNKTILLDPNDKKVIGFHYGETHMAVAMIIYGNEFKNDNLVITGINLLESYIETSYLYINNSAYHWDFNNFAICVLIEYLELNRVKCELCKKLKEFVLKQKDSNNPTINWKPMRIFVNSLKYKWTDEEKYNYKIKNLIKSVESAQYNDGFFEDLLPKGNSFNFQYHIYTTAVLGFLKLRGIIIGDFNRAVNQSSKLIDPTGDINYIGRGINQIFAWGSGIYLFSIINEKKYEQVLQYLYKNSLQAINNNNLILNSQEGDKKNWWWDYHYASVYHAHFAFWMVLRLIENRKLEVADIKINESDSGVHFFENHKYFICSFDGRKHYLAERGKVVNNIYSKERGYIFKGAFGPYPNKKGTYGNLYSMPINTLHNYFGPLVKKRNLLGKEKTLPIFPKELEVFNENDKVIIMYKFKRKIEHVKFNIAFYEKYNKIRVFSDNLKELTLREKFEFDGPYSCVKVFQSNEVKTESFTIILE